MTAQQHPTAGALWRRYIPVWAALMVLLALTCTLAYVHLGAWNAPLSLLVATAKTALVVLFFMGLWRSTALVRLAAAAGLFWLMILFVLTLTDFLARPGW